MMLNKPISLRQQRSRVFLQFCRKGQSSEDCLNVWGPSYWEPPKRSNMEASGGPRVALVVRHRHVFVSGLSGYSCIPEEVILNSTRPKALRMWKHLKSWTGSGLWGRRHRRVWDFPGKDPVSQLFIHHVVWFSAELASVSASWTTYVTVIVYNIIVPFPFYVLFFHLLLSRFIILGSCVCVGAWNLISL